MTDKPLHQLMAETCTALAEHYDSPQPGHAANILLRRAIPIVRAYEDAGLVPSTSDNAEVARLRRFEEALVILGYGSKRAACLDPIEYAERIAEAMLHAYGGQVGRVKN